MEYDLLISVLIIHHWCGDAIDIVTSGLLRLPVVHLIPHSFPPTKLIVINP
jgi:hypothetical protein